MRGLLDYARPRRTTPESIEVDECVDRVVTMLRDQGALKQVQVFVEISSGVPALSGDRHELEQALVNLLLNAVDAMNGNGAVTIAARSDSLVSLREDAIPRKNDPASVLAERERNPRVRAWLHRVGEPARILTVTVADSGPGVPPERRRAHLRSILHHEAAGEGYWPWSRHRCPDRRQPGRGRVGASCPRRRCCIRDDVPARRDGIVAGAAPAADARGRARAVTGMRILIIDDEQALRHTISVILSDEGHEVATATDGEDALAKLAVTPVDLVLCDVRMPTMDGMTFLERHVARGGTALVVMMSAYGDSDTAIAAMQRGAYDWIQKPFRAEEIVLVVRKAMERERLRAEVKRLEGDLSSLRQKSSDSISAQRVMRTALGSRER